MNFQVLLGKMVEKKASDLFITEGKPICVKIYGKIDCLTEELLSMDQAKEVVLGLMNDKQRQEFLQKKEINFAIQVKQYGRFRINAFFQRSSVGAVLRRIETDIPTLEDLQIPKQVEYLAMTPRGMVIIVGATGAGKSSTLAAMIDQRNRDSTGHIVTIEDPIEFIHEHRGCIITQREVGVDTESFDAALKNTLRQAPDVILLGEVRSAETMNYAINFSETGHLCLTTLHANNANQALDRIINFFPHEKHSQVWMDLSLNLRAIVAQRLIPVAGGHGRVPAVEILINTPAIANSIKKGDVCAIKDFIAKGTEYGMQTFDQSLFSLYKEGKITYESALKHADSENEVHLMIKLSKGNKKGTGTNEFKLQNK